MGLCLLAKLFNGALSATHTRSILLLKKNESSHQLWVFNGTLMGLCLLAKFFNGALSSSLLHYVTTEK